MSDDLSYGLYQINEAPLKLDSFVKMSARKTATASREYLDRLIYEGSHPPPEPNVPIIVATRRRIAEAFIDAHRQCNPWPRKPFVCLSPTSLRGVSQRQIIVIAIDGEPYSQEMLAALSTLAPTCVVTYVREDVEWFREQERKHRERVRFLAI